MSNTSHVGRVAQLKNITSKPQLNGTYVEVESYSASSDRFAIRTLVPPNSSAEAVSIAVKLSSLDFPVSTTFSSKYHNASTQRGSFLVNEYPSGTIIDFATTPLENTVNGIPITEIYEDFALAFTHSCRVLGVPVQGPGGPTSFFPDLTAFSPETEPDGIIEVVNIHFGDNVVCSTGHITFRNCKFTSARGVCVFENTRVLFENCQFEENNEYSVHAPSSAHVTLLNCTFQCSAVETGSSVAVEDGSSARVVHCKFVGMTHSVYAKGKANKVELVNCSFTSNTSVGVVVLDGSSCTARGCRWQSGAEQAVKVEGPKRSTLMLEDSVISDCQMGVYAAHGKVDITVSNTAISRSTVHGIHLAMNLAGDVDISNCSITCSVKRDVANMCGALCRVTIDGLVQRQDDQRSRVAAIQPDLRELGRADFLNKGPCRPTLKHLRANKKAGVQAMTTMMMIKCENCGTPEPPDIKFNMCSKCLNVCYCSKDCQVTHWNAAHKRECGIITFG